MLVTGQVRDTFARGGLLLQPELRLGQVLARRPEGITAHQWSTAMRTRLTFLACDADTGAPAFGLQLRAPDERAAREDRMTDAVCAAVGLPLLRAESSALDGAAHARRLAEYVVDARAFTEASGLGYRDLIGRLPDGRTGFVNDLSAVARAAAIDAYAGREVADPTIRGLHVSWRDGGDEGWAWLDLREGQCVFERARVWQVDFSCGVDPARLAEDLAAAAIGERLKALSSTPPPVVDRDEVARAYRELRARRDRMREEFRFEHITFD